MNIPLSNIVSASDIQKNYRQVFDKAKKTKEPVVVMKGNQPEVAVIDIETLEQLQKKAQESEFQDALQAIRITEEEEKSHTLKLLKPGSLAKLAKSK